MTRPLLLALLVLAIVPVAAHGMASHRGWPPYDGMLLMNEADTNRPLDARTGRDVFGGRGPYACKDNGDKLTSSCERWLRLASGGQATPTRPTRPVRVPRPVEDVVEDLPALPADWTLPIVPSLPAVTPTPTPIATPTPTPTPTPSPTPTATPTTTPTATATPTVAPAAHVVAAAVSWVVRRTRSHHRLYGGHGNDTIHAGDNGDVLWGDYKPSGQPTRQRDKLWGGAGPDFIYTSHGRSAVAAGAGTDVIHAHFGRGTIDCGPGRDVVYVHGGKPHVWKRRNCEVVSTKTGESAPGWVLARLPWRITDTQSRR